MCIYYGYLFLKNRVVAPCASSNTRGLHRMLSVPMTLKTQLDQLNNFILFDCESLKYLIKIMHNLTVLIPYIILCHEHIYKFAVLYTNLHENTLIVSRTLSMYGLITMYGIHAPMYIKACCRVPDYIWWHVNDTIGL